MKCCNYKLVNLGSVSMEELKLKQLAKFYDTHTHTHTLTETAQWGARLGWGHVVNKIKLKRKNYKSKQAQRKPKINQIKVLFKQQYNTTIRV